MSTRVMGVRPTRLSASARAWATSHAALCFSLALARIVLFLRAGVAFLTSAVETPHRLALFVPQGLHICAVKVDIHTLKGKSGGSALTDVLPFMQVIDLW
ncbi:hypothetical protein EI94DRAFT_1730067 [Lactarius quietus]|nr:hypothetical protein EI94DRAFT_1730067 [Lactarius quietus]